MTEELFRDDAYLKTCEAKVVSVTAEGIVLDRTVFYPNGGGQPGDTGELTVDNYAVRVLDTRKAPDAGGILHVLESPTKANWVGQSAVARIDWERRYRHMRMHTCMHLLCAVVTGGVTGGSIRDGSARLDFDLPDTLLNKEEITVRLNTLIEDDHAVNPRWADERELDQHPELVRTMSVQPPRGQGAVRLLDIEGVDLQPCGGTHVRRTGEVGAVVVKKIEKKGKHNRRVNVRFADQ
ncbi:MAG: alanyl-tRNA editing protein [Gammaproteobacteria bacterium]|nr:alanyl-tRNA editing protein [Gammaproteobacteria bacterium]